MQAKIKCATLLVVLGCVFVLGFVINANAEPQLRNGDHAVGAASALSGSPVRPHNRAGGPSILITAQGLSQAGMIIEIGQSVTWINQTDSRQTLVSELHRAYFPLLVLGNQVQAIGVSAATPGAWQAGPAPAAWGGDIEPGASYSYTFTSPGDYPYYVAGHPAWSGRVLARALVTPSSTPSITVSPTSVRSVFVDGRVWDDANGNAQVDPSEAGIANASVELWRLNVQSGTQEIYGTATTSAGGSYAMHNSCQFPLCDAMNTYEVRVVAANFGPGGVLVASTPTTGQIVGVLGADGYVRLYLGGQGVYAHKDFGYQIIGTLTIR